MFAPILMTLKTARFEWLVAGLITLFGAVICVFAAQQLASYHIAPACRDIAITGEVLATDVASCGNAVGFLNFASLVPDRALAILPWVGIVVGTVVGAEVVSREVEFGTALFIWAVEPGRVRWLAERFAIAAVMLVLGVGVLGLGTDAVAGARYPGLDVSQSFLSYGEHGLILVARALAALGIALSIGSIVGRVVPSLIIALALSVSVVFAAQQIALSQAHTSIFASDGPTDPTRLIVGSAFRMPDGTLISQDDARSRAPNPGDPSAAQDWVADHFEYVSIAVAGSEAPAVQAEESVALLAASIAGFIAAIFVVRRRKPY